MRAIERLDSIFAEADERCEASGLPEPSIEEVVDSSIQSRLTAWDGKRFESPEDDWGEPVGEEMW